MSLIEIWFNGNNGSNLNRYYMLCTRNSHVADSPSYWWIEREIEHLDPYKIGQSYTAKRPCAPEMSQLLLQFVADTAQLRPNIDWYLTFGRSLYLNYMVHYTSIQHQIVEL